MLDLKFVRENPDVLKTKIKERGLEIDLGPLRELEADRRQLLRNIEELRQQRNAASKEIAARKQRQEDAGADILAMREVSDRIKELEQKMRECDEGLQRQLHYLPNLQDDSVPVGMTEDDNVEVRRWGVPPARDFTPLPHWEVGEHLGILDFERASRMTGARFALYLGLGARLERVLINFMLDLHTREHGYREVLTPFMVNGESLFATGQLPKFENDLFRLEGGRFYLVPTAEVPVTNIHREEILPADVLPLKYAAYTPCFRREAGSHGKDTRGLIRQHQFNKVELVKFVEPEHSFEELEALVGNAEAVLQQLGLPYRVVTLCSGDLGFASAKTYDIEVWMPAQQRYREISSCSNFLDYQARRAAIRYRPERSAKPRLVHTLNGSGLAVGRTVAAILENFQNRDGTVRVPDALVPHLGAAVLRPQGGTEKD
ncbi:serine--tRNA ligase [bacterium]|nr:serine--tRNA ligase [bacterium]